MGPCLVCWIFIGAEGSSNLWVQLWIRVSGDVALLQFGVKIPRVEDHIQCRELRGQLPWELQGELCGKNGQSPPQVARTWH